MKMTIEELKLRRQMVQMEAQRLILFEFVEEVAKGPYKDSNIESLYQTHVARAQTIIKHMTRTQP